MSRKKHNAGPPRSAEDISSDKEALSWIKEVIDADACRFLGYIFYRIGFDPDTYDYGEDKYDVTGILDSIATCVMVKAGYGHADLVRNPYYTPENDPLIMAEVRAFRQTDL